MRGISKATRTSGPALKLQVKISLLVAFQWTSLPFEIEMLRCTIWLSDSLFALWPR